MEMQSRYSRIIPTMRYRNAPAAIEWLCKAFGFAQHLVVPGADGKIAHAQLTFDNGMVMLSSVDDTEFNRLMTHPQDVGGAETQSAYVIVADCDAHYARAKAAGAVMLLDLEDKEYGGRGYTCADLEGHIWSFGNYDPWVPAE